MSHQCLLINLNDLLLFQKVISDGLIDYLTHNFIIKTLYFKYFIRVCYVGAIMKSLGERACGFFFLSAQQVRMC